jgi:transcriptional regulator with XRE-family HTH domain
LCAPDVHHLTVDDDLRRTRLWRLERGLTQAELAALTGLSKSSIERVERCPDGAVNLRHLVNIALVLECELLDVVDDDWLSYWPIDLTVSAPRRMRLGRVAGGPEPRHRRSRALGGNPAERGETRDHRLVAK